MVVPSPGLSYIPKEFTMNIAALQLGFGLEAEDEITLNVYLSGCKGQTKCEHGKCHNPHLRDFSAGKPVEEWWPRIIDIMEKNRGLIDSVVLLGGEPLDQDHEELYQWVWAFKSLFPGVCVYLFTGYDYDEITDQRMLSLFDRVCAGPYREEEDAKVLKGGVA